jgi:hypothetical protein
MSFLDRVTKAVTETVDRGKKEVDEFMRIQKVKGEISEAEKAIEEARNRIQQVKLRLADSTIDMVRSSTLSAAPLQVYLDEIADFERSIAGRQDVIVQKRAEIETIKAETAGPIPPPPPIPTAAVAPEPAATPIVPPPLPVSPVSAPVASPVCPACGTAVAPGAGFCTECGTKLG